MSYNNQRFQIGDRVTYTDSFMSRVYPSTSIPAEKPIGSVVQYWRSPEQAGVVFPGFPHPIPIHVKDLEPVDKE